MDPLSRISKDRKRLETLPDRKSRMQFIWDYYKVSILTVLFLLIVALIALLGSIGKADVKMYAVLLNSDSLVAECDDTVFEKFLEDAGIDMKGKRVDINASLALGKDYSEIEDAQTLQVLTALFTVSELDIFVADEERFVMFIDQDGFCDLSKYIEEDILSRHAEDLYRYEDSKGNTIIGGIILHEGSPIHKAGYYHDDVILGVVAGADHMDEAIAFVKQLLSSC